MKTTIVFLLALGGEASAQSFGAGVHGGVSMVHITSDTVVDTEFVAKPLFGAYGEVAFFDDVLALRLGVDYAGKGGRITSTRNGSPGVEYALDYVQIPVNVRYALGAGLAEAYVLAGTTVAFLASATQRVDNDSGGTQTDVKGTLSSVDVTLDLGAGIGYQILPKILATLEVSYSLGLNQVAGESAELAVKSWKMSSIQILAGLTFTFGREHKSAPGPSMPLQ